MSFPKYPAYKDSGVEWIGEIPTGWECKKFISCLKSSPCYGVLVPNFVEQGIPMLRITDIENGKIDITKIRRIPQYLSDEYVRTIVQEGDVVLSVVGTVGECVIMGKEQSGINLSRALARLQILDKIDKKFIKYFIVSIQFKNFTDLVCVGSAQRVLNMNTLSSMRIPFPSLPEQQAIASFLDRECGKIDALIAEQERLIALLAEKRQAVISHAVTKGLNPNAPMKDSGIPWIRMVPDGWKCCRLRFVAEFNPSKTEISNVPFTEEVSFLPMESIGNDGSIDLSQQRKISDVLNGYTYFRDKDVIFAKITPCFENGKGALVKGLLKGIGFGTTELIVARSISSYVMPDYLFLFFQSYVFRQPAEASMYGAGGQKRVSEQFVRNFTIPLPPLPEQQAITGWVKHECGKIDALIAEQKNMFSLCKERRAALISAAVTGKIDVRNQNKANVA